MCAKINGSFIKLLKYIANPVAMTFHRLTHAANYELVSHLFLRDLAIVAAQPNLSQSVIITNMKATASAIDAALKEGQKK